LNSSIQCLSHTPIFRDYFTSKCYLNDINTSNPLGYEGHLAQVYAILINSIWKRFNQQALHQPKRVTAPGSYAPVNAPALTPKTFKESIGKFNEHFAGNEQHDAQELLAFLLGGLSEDLNRIQNKPYIEAPDSDGRPDCELADIWWSNHLKREMSIIVAMFTGQYKSLLKCKCCKYESARFEPFSFLQLPLPEDDTVPVSLIFYSRESNMGIAKYSVRVHNNGTLYDVLIALAKVIHFDSQTNEKKALGGSGNITHLENCESKSEEEREKLNTIYKKMAQNMAVVDMRESFIFKIAPNVWRLPDLQNKDTGELPLLHVYGLDDLSRDTNYLKEGNGDEKDDEVHVEESENTMPNYSFLALAQRRSELISKDFIHPFSHRVFGTPLLLRVRDLDSLTGGQVYDIVANHLHHLVPQGALKFLLNTDHSTSDKETGPNGIDTTNKTKDEVRQNLEKTTSDTEEVSAGYLPRYGFRLRLASREGRRCSLCPWYECCIGCLVPDNENPTVVANGDSLAIDWHFVVDVATAGFGTRVNQADPFSFGKGISLRGRVPGVEIKTHYSCGVGMKKGQADAITLEDCLDAFAEEERIPEAYCSKCKDFQVQTKRMSLWRLPPVVIIQFKRFQFTQHMRRKLRDFVQFPVEGLDLSRIMATDGTKDPLESGDSNFKKKNGEDKDIVAVDEANEGDASSHINGDNGRGEKLYDLYGVVHHQGALSGGHYVASLKSDIDGQWRLFNDAQVYEIHSRDVVDSSAYILFYIRRDVANQELSDFWDVRKRVGEGLTEDEMNELIKGRSDKCTIS
jgi:ubiquitin C-terminal hydrolase